MVLSVFRTNWFLDMRVARSATYKSVLRSKMEYVTAWTTPGKDCEMTVIGLKIQSHALALPKMLLGLHSKYRLANSSRIRSTCWVSALRKSLEQNILFVV